LNNTIYLSNLLKIYIEEKDIKKDILFLCIGTDRCIGDALGPIVGSTLKKKGFRNVLGTIYQPVHAENIYEAIEIIGKEYKDKTIIAVDSSLAFNPNNVGKIRVRNLALSPGAGVGRYLPKVGDISITGNVGIMAEGLEGLTSQSIRLSYVCTLANEIVDIISLALGEEIIEDELKFAQ
jgi:putative sporulation protein YyaC